MCFCSFAGSRYWCKRVDAIVKHAATGKIGDGKIFIFKIDEAIRIRNLKGDVAAL